MYICIQTKMILGMENNIVQLVRELAKMTYEASWLEFKHNNYNPEMIGQDISALANSATMEDRDYAYMIWGVQNETHEFVGTDYDFQSLKRGNEEIGNWLRHQMSNNADFWFESANVDGKIIGVITIRRALKTPVLFEKQAYIRSGSYTKRLSEFPTLEEKLWRSLSLGCYEDIAALSGLSLDDALRMLKFQDYFDSLGIPQPSTYEGASHYLLEDGLIVKQDDGNYSITNLGALLFAKHLSDFKGLVRKCLRVVQYEGTSRLVILKESTFDEGYALCFENAIRYIKALLPGKEDMTDGKRRTITDYPIPAIREAVSNALIHQQANLSGTSVIVEIFDGRVEITNPGQPLVDVSRIIDNPPKSRNEKLSAMMRRMDMCEELGSGWDRIVESCESIQCRTPRIDVFEDHTRVVIFARTLFSDMSAEDRLWSCYTHACVRYVESKTMTNGSLRRRFGLPVSMSSSVSRLLKDAISRKLVKQLDPSASPKQMQYVPFWA